MQCKLCGAIYLVQSMWRKLSGAFYVVQSMLCKLCAAIYVVQLAFGSPLLSTSHARANAPPAQPQLGWHNASGHDCSNPVSRYENKSVGGSSTCARACGPHDII